MSEAALIGPRLILRANVHGNGALRVEGCIYGNIDVSGPVTLGPGARVEGEVRAPSVRIAGVLVGPVEAAHVTLLESARVVGDLKAEILQLAAGAKLRGEIEIAGTSGPATGSASANMPANAAERASAHPQDSSHEADHPTSAGALPSAAPSSLIGSSDGTRADTFGASVPEDARGASEDVGRPDGKDGGTDHEVEAEGAGGDDVGADGDESEDDDEGTGDNDEGTGDDHDGEVEGDGDESEDDDEGTGDAGAGDADAGDDDEAQDERSQSDPRSGAGPSGKDTARGGRRRRRR